MVIKFEQYFKEWVKVACNEWNFPFPTEKYFTNVNNRLPNGLQNLIVEGINKQLIISNGKKFWINNKFHKKGPYNWFSKFSSSKEPAPNWEWFVHAAEFVRFSHIADGNNLKLNFEDDLMDIALYKDKTLIVCCEVKEKASQLQKLIKGIKIYKKEIDFTINDRGNDSLRKAKYIIKRRPEYFCGVAIGARFEYKVDYPNTNSFELKEDIIPWV